MSGVGNCCPSSSSTKETLSMVPLTVLNIAVSTFSMAVHLAYSNAKALLAKHSRPLRCVCRLKFLMLWRAWLKALHWEYSTMHWGVSGGAYIVGSSGQRSMNRWSFLLSWLHRMQGREGLMRRAIEFRRNQNSLIFPRTFSFLTSVNALVMSPLTSCLIWSGVRHSPAVSLLLMAWYSWFGVGVCVSVLWPFVLGIEKMGEGYDCAVIV